MHVTVNRTLTKTTPPNKKIEGQRGWIVHVLGDGYSLVCFDRLGGLEWYVADCDFVIAENQF